MKTTKPTDDQIKDEIDALKRIKPKVRRLCAMGFDNHHAAIDAQIRVLVQGMDEDDIDDVFGGHDDSVSEYRENVYNAAVEALQWMDGEVEFAESPSAGWDEPHLRA